MDALFLKGVTMARREKADENRGLQTPEMQHKQRIIAIKAHIGRVLHEEANGAPEDLFEAIAMQMRDEADNVRSHFGEAIAYEYEQLAEMSHEAAAYWMRDMESATV